MELPEVELGASDIALLSLNKTFHSIRDCAKRSCGRLHKEILHG